MEKEILNNKIENTKIELIEIDKIFPYINNPRKNKDIDKIVSSIIEFGFQQPIVVDKNNVIVVGHSRFEASKKIGLTKVPVLKTDLSEAQSKAYRIADNRLNEDSAWDLDLLNIEIEGLGNESYDINNLGFKSAELDNLLKKLEPVFEPTNNNFVEIQTDNTNTPMSQVRMIQLFLDSTTEPKFKEMIDNLKLHYNILNLTDVVFKAVENEYNNSKTNS